MSSIANEATGTMGRLDHAIDAAVKWLEREQDPAGFWVGNLESNSSMEAEWLLALHFLGLLDSEKASELSRAILHEQRPDGSWEIYEGATEGDLSTTVECYAALRAAGMSPDEKALLRARHWILSKGGVTNARVFTKIWLAIIGEWPWEGTPAIPPELIFLPAWFPVNIYRFSSWARGTIIPLSILATRRPVKPLPPGRRLDELFPLGRNLVDYQLPRRGRALSWEGFFYELDRVLNYYRAYCRFHPGRETAIRLCVEWILKRQEADGAWAGIQPPWIYSLLALRVEGYSLEHPVLRKGIQAALSPPWSYITEHGRHIQACISPVWDTLLAMMALLDCGLNTHNSECMSKALNWVLQKQVFAPGDWCVVARNTPPGGWPFEHHNNCYPDVDDTAVALIVLARLQDAAPDHDAAREAIQHGVDWVMGMRSSNGAWAAFDKDNTSHLIASLPFCDFGEALDPPSVDVTAHVLEAFGYLGMGISDPAVAPAIDYIKSEQEPEGSWFGRWGVNHIYGTAAVLPALREVGEFMAAPYVQKAARWILDRQNPDGGWGETCASYMDDSLRGVGPSTPSQTAWALIALLATGDHDYDPAIRKGLDFLLGRQTEDGTWDEPEYTGTGFPGYGQGARTDIRKEGNTLPQGTELGRGFMINYNMYRHYFPLMAMGRARKHLAHS